VFEVWYFAAEKCYEVGFTLENTWASHDSERSASDTAYSFSLAIGNKQRQTVYRNTRFHHIAFSRWHTTFSSAPQTPVSINHNASYLVSTGALPHWNTNLRLSPLLLRKSYDKWHTANHSIGGKDGALGQYSTSMNAGGAADWIGLATTWDILYLLSSADSMKEVSYGNADVAGGMPYHFREADPSAGSGQWFDRPKTGHIESFGRIVSINARQQVSLSNLDDDCSGTSKADSIKVAGRSSTEWPTDLSHMPDLAYLPYVLSGKFYYLSELQYQAGFVLGTKLGCTGGDFARQGSLGLLNESQLRGEAWGLRTISYAAFISPDGSPEKKYFDEKLRNNFAELEAQHLLPNSFGESSAAYEWGKTKSNRSQWRDQSPLHFWEDRGPEFIQEPLKRDGSLSGAASPWEENFLTCVLGVARQFGYPTKGLLTYMAHRPLNTVLNPAVGAPILIESYRYPTRASDHRWIADWHEFPKFYEAVPKAWQRNGNIDHSYGFIAMSAISFFYDISADGYSGRDAWNYMLANKPEQDRLGTESPKWSLTPTESASP
jgi:hypothetical protein